ncbi:quinone oxidoreductase family protein [Cupriavidus oxalaticus]|uniref:Oxidoreductase n=1 Tax=Cupriavidus oxalaticus TaxID=96344 RepID=A0A976GD83_9BURK|nr:zinc-binding alcohol dehydrogenase family protein [Cupriavidus oxalaticus]QRQ85200.1 zinc-binding alcohol dehydrogenase family protein [Cupriavidus oxalaticus]QRQ90712.1 zinc-binding alcohol dehydrogenase family protein [Cupriavidus oxalaticus]WQD85239.1 zinc-binding alcohol dehydrogenase family protein [Cupriavidus oxalaticus]SPC23447.1 Oxidoreductase [Cupriavidus oxalaticus]
MNTIRVNQKAADIEALQLELLGVPRPDAAADQCIIEVASAGVNPSDVKATLGLMPHAVWPRTPGRDYAGLVVDGPAALLGLQVWGSGGELGIRRDGTHGKYLSIQASAVRAKPASVSLLEAGAVGVPFITAFEGLRRAGMPQAGSTVLVCGGNGKVGQATIQIATALGARVFAVERTAVPYRGHASGEVRMIDASREAIAEVVRDETGGHGADIVYNTVGSPYFEQANRAMATGATQIFISTIEKPVPFDIFAFYRGQHTYVGVDTLALDSGACAQILDQLAPMFASGELRPFPVLSDYTYALANAKDAYRAVLQGATERVVLKP